jgi:zinc-binding alcohol dehydrogenase/oxidoreductase
MQAIVLREIGGPQQLHLEEIDAPVPAPGELLVKIRYAAFNRRDVFIAQGLYPGIVFPVIPGSDTLLGMPHYGTFAEYVALPASNVFAKPARLSDEQVAALPLAGLTAYRAVFTRGRCTSDDVVLIPGIGGGVQTFALQFAKSIGARTIVTSSSDRKLARARELGADVTVNYVTSENWSKEVRAQSDGGPTLVIDSAGGATLAKALDIARPGARVVIYGGTTGDATVRPFSIFWKHLDILGTSMGSPADFSAMLQLFDDTTLAPAIDEVVDLAGVPEAAERLRAGDQFGKIVVRVSAATSA